MLFDHFEVWEEKEGGTWDRCGHAADASRAASKWAARDTAYKLYNTYVTRTYSNPSFTPRCA